MKKRSSVLSPVGLLRPLGLLAALVLAGCGGGGGGTSSSATEMGSLYLGTGGAREFWALSLSQTGGGKEFYALSFPGAALSSAEVLIYSGSLSLGSQGSASVASLLAYRENASLRSGSAAFRDVSVQSLDVTFTLNDASAPPESARFTATQASPVNALAGSWSGRWIDGLRSNSAFSLPGVAPNGKTLITPLAGCSGVELGFGPFDTASGLYRVQIRYPNSTQCYDRDNKTLHGLAAVQGAGAQQQLRLVAVDSSGSGISFVGRPSP